MLDSGDDSRAMEWKQTIANAVGLSGVLPGIGDFGDVAHSADARALAAAAATGPRGAFHYLILLSGERYKSTHLVFFT